jgi:endogenous inhibitor of DNA gyrase (YacG/DUF329 family)
MMVGLSPEEKAQLGRLLASMRRRQQKVCVECGQPYEGLTFQLYCSVRCQKRALWRRYYWENREAVLARQRAWRERRKAQREGQA